MGMVASRHAADSPRASDGLLTGGGRAGICLLPTFCDIPRWAVARRRTCHGRETDTPRAYHRRFPYGRATGGTRACLRASDGRASVRLGQAQTCQDGRRQIARHTDWKRTGGALGITRVDACAPFGFGLRRIFPPKAFAFFGTSTTNTHNGLHTDARRTFPIAQAPHRARRSPRALIKSIDKANEEDSGFRRSPFYCIASPEETPIPSVPDLLAKRINLLAI